MVTWWLDEADWWVAPAVWLALTVAMVALLKYSTKLSTVMLTNCAPENLKDASKSMWTNVGVAAALLCGISSRMTQVGPIKFVGNGSGTSHHVQSLYGAFAWTSMFACLLCIIMCIINRTCIETLSKPDAIKFFIANPNGLGTPTAILLMAALYLMLANLMWVIGAYGVVQGSMAGVLVLVIVGVCIFHLVDKLAFDPHGKTKRAEEWQWVDKPQEEWPYFVQAKDQASIETYKKMSLAAKRLEEKAHHDHDAPEHPVL